MVLLRKIHRLAALLMASGLLFQAALADTGTAVAVRIGVLAYKGPEAVQEDWSYVSKWLESAIPEHRFSLLDFDRVEASCRLASFVPVLFGYFPARCAARRDPIEAPQPEQAHLACRTTIKTIANYARPHWATAIFDAKPLVDRPRCHANDPMPEFIAEAARLTFTGQ